MILSPAWLLALLLIGHSPTGGEDVAVEPVDFNSDIRPLLAQRCLPCHGNDPETRKKSLRLDDRDSATADRGDQLPAITPGDSLRSLMFLRINDDDDPMPPDDRERVTPEERALIARWIEEGAHYDPHWSWQPIEAITPPEISNESWPRDPLDRFILEGLEGEGLTPAEEADRLTLLRRATFDVIGIPPTIEEQQEFLADNSHQAWEKVVDRLLASPGYGERWGRHWLDLMRYAETYGHEFDYPIHDAWRYRDYVIRSFDEDLPVDDLVMEHIAGDLLPSKRRHPTEGYDESLIATGWWWLTQGKHAPVDVRQEEADRIDNQIDVLSKSFLGITVSCARCHDHKFDAITQADYTALVGFVESSRRQRAYLDPDGKREAALSTLSTAVREANEILERNLGWKRTEPLVTVATAARDLIEGRREFPVTSDRKPVMVQNFEAGFGDWVATGDAFGGGPRHRQDLSNEWPVALEGDQLALSQVAGEVADKATGRLTSPPFLINYDWLRFLVAGGNHGLKTCVNLLVDGEVVLTTSGKNSTLLTPCDWEVTEWRGQEAVIEVVDEHTGGWGHIACDRFLLTDEAPEGIPGRLALEAVSLETGAPAREIRSWTRSWQSLLGGGEGAGELREEDLLFEDFDDPSAFSRWFNSGDAFGTGPAVEGSLYFRGRPRAVTASGAASGLVASRLEGTLRSENFTIDHDFIHYRLRGTKSRARLVIDGFWLDEFNALLFESMIQKVDSGDQWRVMSHDVSRYQGHRAYIELIDDDDGTLEVDRIWFSDHRDAPSGAPIDWSILDDPETTTSDLLADPRRLDRLLGAGLVDLARVGEAWDASLVKIAETLGRLDRELPRPMRALAIEAGSPVDEVLFNRGNHRNPGPTIRRRFLESLDGDDPGSFAGIDGRLELGRRIVSEENPLFWRTQANRIWGHLMGQGLVPTPDDLGALGIPPTHPQLLDHLADRLREDPSIKGLIRSILLSSTYRMSSRHGNPRCQEVDPDNRLYHRSPLKRLEGEALRDSMLAISGRLDPRRFGAPVAVHLTPFLGGRGRPGHSGPVDGDGRRSIYLAVRRNFLVPMLTAFDFPIPSTTFGKRNVSNVPAQALMLMNDPFVHDQARLWSEKIEALEGDLDGRVEALYRQGFGRPPTEREQAVAREYIESAEESAKGWQDLCHALFQAKEFRYIR